MRLERLRALTAATLAVALWAAACERAEREPPAQGGETAARILARAGPYAIAGGALYRSAGESLVAVAVLPDAGESAADTLEECAAEIPQLGKARFQSLSLAADTALAAWATSGPSACVGVVGTGEPAVRVLGHWSAAVLDTILWAPAGRYLAVWLSGAAGRRSLEVFDALAGARLEMPWEVDCGYAESCDVVRATWLGGTLLDVEIGLGPAELPVPFEVNVADAVPVGSEEEN